MYMHRKDLETLQGPAKDLVGWGWDGGGPEAWRRVDGMG